MGSRRGSGRSGLDALAVAPAILDAAGGEGRGCGRGNGKGVGAVGRAGVAAAAVPAPAARSGVAGAATPGSWGPRPRRDGRDRSVWGLRACAGMSRCLQAPVPPLARRMSPRRFPRFRVYNETGTDQTDPQSNGHHRKFARSNGSRLNGRRGTMDSPLLEAGLVYRDGNIILVFFYHIILVFLANIILVLYRSESQN